MAFPLKDVRFTVRRDGAGEPVLHPRWLRDRSVLPKLSFATRYFESMLGRERSELEPEVLVEFFGDHRLARCLVACVARSYRYQPQRLEEIVTRRSLRRLQRDGVDSPMALRCWLFDRVNDGGHGYLPGAERGAVIGQMEAELGLRAGELERLLYIDAEGHAILRRVGAEPRPEDIVAQYNFRVLETFLRHAEQIVLALAEGMPEETGPAVDLCAASGVEVRVGREFGPTHLLLVGRQDALGSWARHGRKVARAAIQLLERVRAKVGGGEATVALRDRKVTLRLTPEVLDVLGGAPATSTGWEEREGWGRAALAEATGSLRGAWPDWGVRRMPDAQAWRAGVIVPDLQVRDGSRRALVCAVRSAAHGARLAPVAQAADTGDPFVFIGDAPAVAPLQAAGVRAVAMPRLDLEVVADALREVFDTSCCGPQRTRKAG